MTQLRAMGQVSRITDGIDGGQIMKKTFRLFSAAVAAIVFASCADTIGNDINAPETDASVQDGNLVQMTFSASMAEDIDSKTTYSARKVYWEASDAITVFSVGENVTKTPFSEPELLENGAVARFSGVADASAETYYAVYPHSESNTYDNGTFSVVFPHTHVAVANGFPSGSNVSVAVSVKDAEATGQNLQFMNVGALLAFSFNTAEDAANTKSVTFKARKSADDAETPEFWGLTGEVTVVIDENGLPVASPGSVDHVTVVAPDGGFVHGKGYYIPVCPVGDCTGMVVTFTNQNNETFVKNNNVDFQLLRSYMFNAGKVLYPYDTLPKNFTITWNFVDKQWPFNEDCQYVSSSGEYDTYSYPYEYNGENMSAEWQIRMGYKPYELTDTGLKHTTENSFIVALPAVEGRYLTNITVSLASDSKNSRPALQDRWGNHSDGQYCLLARKYLKKGTSCTIDLYNDVILFSGEFMASTTSTSKSADQYEFKTSERANFVPAAGKSYYLKLRDLGIISQITLTYSSTSLGNIPAAATE